MIRLKRTITALTAFAILFAPSVLAKESAGKLKRALWAITTPGWCSGVCEIYATQIEISKENAKPNADKKAMIEAENKAWFYLRTGDISTASHFVEDQKCFARIGSRCN